MESIVLVIVFFILLLTGFPIGFVMLTASLSYFATAWLTGNLIYPVTTIARVLAQSLDSFTLIAIPLFVLAGHLMNEGGVTRRIFEVAKVFVGHIRGGLGLVNILASMIFAGISGSAAADAGGLGPIEMKAMMDAGYEKNFSAAVTAASAVIGPIFPPSVLLILYGITAEVSIAALFLAGIVPGILIGLFEMFLVNILARTGKVECPIMPKASFADFLRASKDGILALLAPIIILTGFISGLFTPTEAGSVAAGYAMFLGLVVYQEMGIQGFLNGLRATMVISAEILFFIAASAVLGRLLTMEQVPQMLAAWIISITESKIIVILLINLFLLILGCFMSGTAGIVLVTPLLLPLARLVGIDLVHFGIIVAFNLVIGGLTPPVGSLLFILSKIAKVDLSKLIVSLVPFYVILIFLLLIISYWPEVTLFLPRLILG